MDILEPEQEQALRAVRLELERLANIRARQSESLIGQEKIINRLGTEKLDLMDRIQSQSAELARLRSIIDTHDLCHNLGKVDARAFADGCTQEQRKHFGCAPDADEVERLRAELDRRKGDPVTRLHNLCEGIAADADCTEWSHEEWERIDREKVVKNNIIESLEKGIKELEVACSRHIDAEENGEPTPRFSIWLIRSQLSTLLQGAGK